MDDHVLLVSTAKWKVKPLDIALVKPDWLGKPKSHHIVWGISLMQVLFSPQKPGQQSVDYLDVIALGATNCSVIKCIGIGKGEVLIIIITIINHLVLFFLVPSFTLK